MKVAVAIIYDPQGSILITQRAAHLSSGGLWEFPGGKLEPNETPEAALIREIKEEVNLDILRYDFIGKINSKRIQGPLSLDVFLVHEFHGQAIKLESQADLLWVIPQTLEQYKFPLTNAPILAWIKKYPPPNLVHYPDHQYDYSDAICLG